MDKEQQTEHVYFQLGDLEERNRVQKLPGLVNAWRFGERSTPGERVEAPPPIPILCCMDLFHLDVNKLVT